MHLKPPVPRVLCLSGHDPGGGAGIQADIESVAAQGAHALTVITALTVQDTHNVRALSAVPAELMAQQLALLEADGVLAAIKIGLLGDVAQVRVIADLLRRQPGVPVVFDPVLRAGGGTELVNGPLQAAVLDTLLPLVDLLTPNAAEARRLAGGEGPIPACAARLLDRGCRNLLVTGGDEPGEAVLNTWFRPGAEPVNFQWTRLPGGFHGAGCTLASAIAGQLACGATMAQAISEGQRWTQATLAAAIRVGRGRSIPLRR
ncbi:MAG: bifunctional hydroxymethylpyrimidine kinase/phosphomethylpyrimidine kinase [Panacagrimonas sp.]